MNKKSLLIKIIRFINEANIKYKKSNTGDMTLIILFIFTLAFGIITAFMTMVLVFVLRSIFEFNISERLEAVNEEENNKTNDEENIENIR